MFSTGAIMAAQEIEPMASMTCCRHGVAPTRYPALRSCRLSPATQAAQHTTAPIMTAATGPIVDSLPRNASNTNAANRIVAIVMPETGLLDEPTRPAMYADTEQKRNPATTMITDIAAPTPTLP